MALLPKLPKPIVVKFSELKPGALLNLRKSTLEDLVCVLQQVSHHKQVMAPVYPTLRASFKTQKKYWYQVPVFPQDEVNAGDHYEWLSGAAEIFHISPTSIPPSQTLTTINVEGEGVMDRPHDVSKMYGLHLSSVLREVLKKKTAHVLAVHSQMDDFNKAALLPLHEWENPMQMAPTGPVPLSGPKMMPFPPTTSVMQEISKMVDASAIQHLHMGFDFGGKDTVGIGVWHKPTYPNPIEPLHEPPVPKKYPTGGYIKTEAEVYKVVDPSKSQLKKLEEQVAHLKSELKKKDQQLVALNQNLDNLTKAVLNLSALLPSPDSKQETHIKGAPLSSLSKKVVKIDPSW